MRLGIYKHSKSGNKYEVIGVAKHSETLADLVIYKSLYKTEEFDVGTLWARPKEMFVETVVVSGNSVSRFEKVENNSNYAFIDGQNLHMGTKTLSWDLDYYRFRHYLSSKFGVQKAYIYLGYVKSNEELYKYLKESGFELVFKKVVSNKDGKVKGNVDIDLAVHAIKLASEYNRAVLITSDGDFTPLIRYLKKQNKFAFLIAPIKKKCSHLLKLEVKQNISFLDDIKDKIKRRHADR